MICTATPRITQKDSFFLLWSPVLMALYREPFTNSNKYLDFNYKNKYLNVYQTRPHKKTQPPQTAENRKK